MDDALTESKQRSAQFIVRSRQRDFQPLAADQWVTISLLQKSIRRAEVETAQRAAFTLFAHKGSAIWRRFMVIAFEDVGAASAEAVAMTVAASTDSSWCKKMVGTCILRFSSPVFWRKPRRAGRRSTSSRVRNIIPLLRRQECCGVRPH